MYLSTQTSKHYELLNYSEHGTTVDNVLYSCDFSDKPATTPHPSAVVAAVRHLNKTHKPKMKADERLTSTRGSEVRTRVLICCYVKYNVYTHIHMRRKAVNYI